MTPSPDALRGAESAFYRALGVSAAKEDLVQLEAYLAPAAFEDTFARLVRDPSSAEERYLCLHSDGAGSKAQLALTHYLRHGDPTVFSKTAVDAAVMNIDDVLCAADVDAMAISVIVNRDRAVIDDRCLAAISEGIATLAQRLAPSGLRLAFVGGETADMPEAVNGLLVDASVVSVVDKDAVQRNRVRPGQVIVGLRSGGGPVSWDPEPNSGIGSNGLTAARSILDLDDEVMREGVATTALDACLDPTRTMAPVLVAHRQAHPGTLRAVVHNTGGGHTKSMRFARGCRIVKELPTRDDVFSYLGRKSSLPLAEMVRMFNLGYRVEAYLDSDADAEALIATATALGVGADVIGRTVASEAVELEISSGGEVARIHPAR